MDSVVSDSKMLRGIRVLLRSSSGKVLIDEAMRIARTPDVPWKSDITAALRTHINGVLAQNMPNTGAHRLAELLYMRL